MKNVVDEHEALKVHRLAVLHEVRAPYLDEINVDTDDGHRRQGTRHQEPAVHPVKKKLMKIRNPWVKLIPT